MNRIKYVLIDGNNSVHLRRLSVDTMGHSAERKHESVVKLITNQIEEEHSKNIS